MNRKMLLLMNCLLLSSALSLYASGQQTDRETRPAPQQGQQMGNNQGPDFEAAAEKLGISVNVLMDAFKSVENQGKPGEKISPEALKAVAQTLDVTEQQLMDALGASTKPQGEQSQKKQMGKSHGGPDFSVVAEKLGVSEDVLMEALNAQGNNGQPGSPEALKEAANILGVTEKELMEAMGPPPIQ